MSTRLASLHKQAAHDEGVTLIELLVSIGLTMIASTSLMMIFVRGLDASMYAQDKQESALQAKTVSENVTKALRTAVDPDGTGPKAAFELAEPQEVIFYAAMGNRTGTRSTDTMPSKIRVWRDGSQLKMTKVPATLVSGTWTWTSTGSTRVLSAELDPTAGRIFTYFKTADLTATGQPVSSLPMNSTGGLPTANYADVKAVQTSFTLIGQSRSKPKMTFSSLVSLLNKE